MITHDHTHYTRGHKMKTPASEPLRLWPGVVIVILQWLVRFGLPVVAPEAMPYGVLGGLAGGLAIVVWWAFFSRSRWFERLGAVVLMIVALLATSRIIHVSIATGAMGLLFPILAIPILSLAFVAWAVASSRLSDRPRRATMVVTILLSCGALTLARTGGFTGNLDNDLHWRWTKTPEERLLTQSGNGPSALLPAPAAAETPEKQVDERLGSKSGKKLSVLPVASSGAETGADWPGFRGPHRDGIIPGVRIKTDWTASPPVALWCRPVGPGWSSFAVRGGLLYTQEQRGSDEVVACRDRFFIHDFFVFLQDNSCNGIFAKEFRKCNIPET
jgi:outer membrane protein assembly factor BamB